MKTTSISTFLLAAVLSATSVSAKCYSGEVQWDNKDTAAWHAGRACRGYDGKQGAFQGWFSPGETKHVCVDSGLGQRFDFTIINRNWDTGFDLGDDDCANRLSNEIYGCAYGGESEVAGWMFR